MARIVVYLRSIERFGANGALRIGAFSALSVVVPAQLFARLCIVCRVATDGGRQNDAGT